MTHDCRVEFGEMKTLHEVKTNIGYVYHMELDLRDTNTILYSDWYSLRMLVGTRTTTIAGPPTSCSSDCAGYQEGVGSAARFYVVSGFLQLNSSTVVAVDQYSNCLRVINRDSKRTSQFAGKCSVHGFDDGVSATFHYPWSVIRDIRSPDLLLVTDYWNHAVRQVNILTKVTTTLIRRAAGLNYPSYITYDPQGQYLVISNDHFIAEKRNNSEALVNVIGSTSSGFADGSVSDVRFSSPRELVFLSDDLRLVADGGNNRLRVLNTTSGTVSSICSGSGSTTDGPALTCGLYGPFSLMVNDGLIYIGQWNAISTIPCEYL